MPTYGLGPNYKPVGPALPPLPKTPVQQYQDAQPATAFQDPGNNLYNPGYTEQNLQLNQNRLQEDPFGQKLGALGEAAATAGQGEKFLGSNLGTLQGPGQGDQYWNQQQGQYMDPFAGEQYARQATQQFAPQGAASAFNDKAQQQYGAMTNYSTGNAQGQYGQSSSQLAGGTQGENTLGQIAGGYQQNGQYTGQNLAAGQYQQTQGAFGDMPIANFDPFYDRARQLATQDYNRQSAGRGVYGSSEALSGVGNVITDIEAQRANRSFDANMQIAQEQRARQELLGNQARMGDLSGTDAFSANLKGAETYGNIANQQGQLEIDRHQTLGAMANNADTQATSAQNARTDALSAFGTIANNADQNETSRYTASTNAMNQADRMGLDRMNAGAEIAFKSDENKRANYDSEANAAKGVADIRAGRIRDSASIFNQASANDLQRLNATSDAARSAELDRQGRMNSQLSNVADFTSDMGEALDDAYDSFLDGDQAAWEDQFNAAIVPFLQKQGLSAKQIDEFRGDGNKFMEWVGASKSGDKKEK